jgi:glutaminase
MTPFSSTIAVCWMGKASSTLRVVTGNPGFGMPLRCDPLRRVGVYQPSSGVAPGPAASPSMQALLNEILDEVRPLIGRGKVADYIPALADVPANQLGIAVYSNEGELFCAGDAATAFSVQSISKVFGLVQAIEHSGEAIWQRLGHEPSGQPFNSLVQLEFERGRPRNPFINAGALVICDINQSRFAAPVPSLRDFVRRLAGNPLVAVDNRVADSEYQHRARNAAAAYLMQSFGNFHNDVETVLRSYFQPLRPAHELRRPGAGLLLSGQRRFLQAQRRADPHAQTDQAGQRDHGHQRPV